MGQCWARCCKGEQDEYYLEGVISNKTSENSDDIPEDSGDINSRTDSLATERDPLVPRTPPLNYSSNYSHSRPPLQHQQQLNRESDVHSTLPAVRPPVPHGDSPTFEQCTCVPHVCKLHNPVVQREPLVQREPDYSYPTECSEKPDYKKRMMHGQKKQSVEIPSLLTIRDTSQSAVPKTKLKADNQDNSHLDQSSYDNSDISIHTVALHTMSHHNSQASLECTSTHLATSDLKEVSPLMKRQEIKCPLSKSMSYSLDHNGGIIIGNGIKLTIPEGAIADGVQVKFHIATNLYGPFKLPSHCQTDLVSPYYWIGVSGSYQFQKPVQVEFEHFAVVTACDPSHYRLLTCEDYDESYTMRLVDYDLSFKVQDMLSLCTFQTIHFCSYCLFHDCKVHDQKNRIGAFYLKPANFRHLTHFTVEIWFSFLISHCLKRNEELYKKKHMILDDSCNHIFEVSCDKSSKSYFALKYDQHVDGWCVDHSRSTEIETKQVNFLNYYTSKEELEASEENSLFPPRFIVNVAKQLQPECTTNLDIKLMVTLCNKERTTIETIPFKLFVSIFAMTINASATTKNNESKERFLPSIGRHSCDKNKPELKELVTYSTKISDHWKEIALQLNIPSHDVTLIDINFPHNEKGKCYRMFETWLSRNPSASLCWCHFVQALYDVRLNAVAEEAKKHLEIHTQSHDISGVMAAALPDVNENLSTLNDADDTLTLEELLRYLIDLKDIPDKDFYYFVKCLLSKNIVVDVIKDIRRNGRSREENIKKICEAFIKDKDPSWSKVHKALKAAQCNDLAEIIEAIFLPI